MTRRFCLGALLALLLSACASASTPVSSPAPPATNTLFPTPTLVSRDDPDPLKILFIGNSHTFMNDLPNTFAELARSGGHKVDVDSSTRGGYSLEDHTTDQRTLEKLDSANWDLVILQEKSGIPRSESDLHERMVPAARALDGKIKEKGAQTIFYMTWASLDTLAGSGIERFVDEQEQVSAGFMAVAGELDAAVAPVGAAWARSLTHNPDLVLWQGDNVHANRNGTYLAACVFYAVIYRQSPSGLDHTAGLPDDTAQFLQRIAAQTVPADSADGG